ncbi:MAG: glycosyltransferase [Candidatus Methanomethylicia archaeon]
MVKQLMEKYSIIRYYDIGFERRNISLAKNFGAKISMGDYLFFVDSDWILDNNALEVLAEIILTKPAISAACLRINGEVGYIGKCYYKLREFSSAQSYMEYASQLFGLRGCPTLFRREEFFKIGGFDPFLPALEDADMAIRFALKGVNMNSLINMGHHKQLINLKSIVVRRIRSTLAAEAFNAKYCSENWMRIMNIIRKRENVFLRALSGIVKIARHEPKLLIGSIIIMIFEVLALIIAGLYVYKYYGKIKHR